MTKVSANKRQDAVGSSPTVSTDKRPTVDERWIQDALEDDEVREALACYRKEDKAKAELTLEAHDQACRFPMPDRIAKADIEQLKKLLETETDVQKRGELERLLANEELKLAALKK